MLVFCLTINYRHLQPSVSGSLRKLCSMSSCCTCCIYGVFLSVCAAGCDTHCHLVVIMKTPWDIWSKCLLRINQSNVTCQSKMVKYGKAGLEHPTDGQLGHFQLSEVAKLRQHENEHGYSKEWHHVWRRHGSLNICSGFVQLMKRASTTLTCCSSIFFSKHDGCLIRSSSSLLSPYMLRHPKAQTMWFSKTATGATPAPCRQEPWLMEMQGTRQPSGGQRGGALGSGAAPSSTPSG